MTDEFLTIEVPMSMFNGAELIGLGTVTEVWHPRAEAFAILVFSMVSQEMERRNWNTENPHDVRESGYGRIRPADWSDRDIGDAAMFCWAFCEHARDPKLGEFLDAMGEIFIALAAERLRASADPRNATTFEDRNRKVSDDGTSEVPEV